MQLNVVQLTLREFLENVWGFYVVDSGGLVGISVD